MTRDETKRLLTVMQAAYPNYKPQDKTMTVDLWTAMLGDYEYQAVVIALQAYIATDRSGFAPSVGQVIGKLQDICTPERMDGMAAWDLVRSAISNSAWEPKKQFDKLPPDVRRVVGSAQQLHNWAIDEDFNEGVVMSHFIRAYDAREKKRAEYDALPSAAKGLIEDLSHRLEG